MKTPPRISEELLREALAITDSPDKAAGLLGVSRRTLYRWMSHYGIRRTFDKAAA